MFNILIVTHGNFGKEILNSLELIIGKTKNIEALGLHHGDSIEALFTRIYDIVNTNLKKNKKTLILVDLLGGSPANIAMKILKDFDVKIISGVNLPMVLAAIEARETYDNNYFENVYKRAQNAITQQDRKIFSENE